METGFQRGLIQIEIIEGRPTLLYVDIVEFVLGNYQKPTFDIDIIGKRSISGFIVTTSGLITLILIIILHS